MRMGRASSLSRKSGLRYASGCCDIEIQFTIRCYDSPRVHRRARRSRIDDRRHTSAMKPDTSAPPGLDISMFIAAPPGVVMKAFFDHQALAAWWQVAHA